MVRFSSQSSQNKDAIRFRSGTAGPGKYRLALLLVAMLFVLAARAKLKQPEVRQAVGNMLEASEGIEKLNTTAAVASLDLLGPPALDEQQLTSIEDNAPFRSAEQEAWFVLLGKLQAESVDSINEQSLGKVGYAALNSNADTYRGRIVTVHGTAMQLEETKPADNDLGIEKLFVLTIQPDGGEVWPISIYLLNEPNLNLDADKKPSIQIDGYFFKNQSYRWAQGVGSMPVLLGKEISKTKDNSLTSKVAPSGTVLEKQPERPTDTVRLTDSDSLGRALLEDLGVDLNLLNNISDRQAFTQAERDPFYAILEAVGQTPARQLARLAEGGLPQYAKKHGIELVADAKRPTDRQAIMSLLVSQSAEEGKYSSPILFGIAEPQRGELLSFDGTVRRVVRIDVPNEPVGYYYELELFPDDSQNLPLVFCMREIPEGFPVGDEIRLPARLTGFFFKQWAYRTRHRGESAGEDARQFAPLLIGRAPIPLAMPNAADNRPGLVVGIVGTLLILSIAAGVWYLNRLDSSYEIKLKTVRQDAPDPDFSHLS